MVARRPPAALTGMPDPDDGRRRWHRQVDDMLYKAATNRTAHRVDDTGVRSIRALVRKAGGTKAAAERFGVSVRAVQRWTAKNPQSRGKPSRASAAKITAAATEQRRTELRQSTSGRRAARMRTTGATLSTQGRGGPKGYGDERPRSISINLTGDQVADLYQAMSENTDIALDLIDDLYAEIYMRYASTNSWEWGEIDKLDLWD